ncbi:MAG: winged helix-turn-helix domain-containing protein [Acidimicrobiia bacterium]
MLHLLRDHAGLAPKVIAEKLGIAPATIRQTVGRMVDDEQLDTDGAGTYFLPLQSAVTPVTAVTQPSDTCDTSDTYPEEDE